MSYATLIPNRPGIDMDPNGLDPAGLVNRGGLDLEPNG